MMAKIEYNTEEMFDETDRYSEIGTLHVTDRRILESFRPVVDQWRHLYEQYLYRYNSNIFA